MLALLANCNYPKCY